MAGPFHYFRKHQKPLIAAAAVLCMIIFVFSDALVGIIKSAAGGGESSRSAKSTVATWDGGSLNESELAILRSRRFFLSEFLRRLQITGAQRVIADGGTPTKPTIPDFILPENTTARAVDMSVVTSRVFADLALHTGIRVSDQVINHYLREAGFHRVGGDELVEMLKAFRVADRQANANILFESLRDNLLAHTYQSGTAFASQTILPEQRWEDWRRVNERIALEVAVLPVGGMLAEVPEPSEEELLAFYQEYRGRLGGQLQNVMGAERTSPEPGFTQPRKVRLHYLLGDVFSWSEKLQETITDAEIEEYYQRNKRAQFVQTDASMLDSADSTEATDNPAATETPVAEEDPAADEPAEDGPAEDGPIEETPAEDGSSADGPAEDGAAEEEESAEEKPSDSTGSMRKTGPFRLVAFQQEGEVAAGEETSGDLTASDETAETAETEETEEAVSGEASAAPSTSEADNQEGAEIVEESDPVESSGAEPAEPAGDGGSAGNEEEQVQYLPLENVRDQIRRQLATDKAVKQLKTTIDRLFIQLRTVYNEEYGEKQAIALAQDSELPTPPQQLTSLGNLAKEHGLTYEETPLLSGLQLARESLVGKAMDARTGRASVTQRMLGDHSLYDPLIAKDIDGNWYLVIKVEDTPQHIPQLDEIRSEVIEAWKIQKAAQLALEKAEAWVTEAKESSDSFGEFFSDKLLTDKSKVEMVTTDLFSWLTFGATPAEMQRGPRLGDAPPLAGVGPEFMTGAFELKQDELKVLQNYDHSQVYVARIHQREMSEEQLRNLFLSESNSWFGARFSTMARWQRFQRMVFQQLTTRVNLDFEEGWGQ